MDIVSGPRSFPITPKDSTTRLNHSAYGLPGSLHSLHSFGRPIEDLSFAERTWAFVLTIFHFAGIGCLIVLRFILVVCHAGGNTYLEDFESMSERSMLMLLGTGYGIGAVLLVAYFLVEDGPCHWNRSIESAYLTYSLLLLDGTSVIIWRDTKVGRDDFLIGGSSRPVYGLMRWIVLFNILDQVESLRLHPKFHDGTNGRAATLNWGPAQTHRSKRVAQVVEIALREILDLKSKRNHWISTSSRTLPWIIFVLGLVGSTMDTLPSSRFASFAYVVSVLIISLFLVSFIFTVWKKYQAGPIARRLGDLMEGLVECGDCDDLQYVLANSSVGTLIEVVRWKTIWQLTDLALREEKLSTLSKAILVDAFQKSGLKTKKSQLAVLRLVRSCYGTDLTTLKNLIDGGGDYLNLYKLVYHDITNKDVRNKLIRHLSAEGQCLRAELGRSFGIKLLSDVDDTLYSSGGTFPGGCDKRFPKNVVYPGFLSLLRVLDREAQDAPSCNIVFISARPHVYKDVAEDHSYTLFKELVEGSTMHSFPTLLPGRLWESLQAMAMFPFLRAYAWRPVGDLKLATYENFRKLYLEYDFVFCGDNGQGDLWAAQHMLQCSNEGGSQMLAVLIHEVMPEERCLAREPREERGPQWRESLREKHLFFHHSYVGAALSLHKARPELVTLQDVRQIAAAAVDEFDNARLMYAEWGDRWAAAAEDLRDDLAEANDLLMANNLAPVRRLEPTTELLRTVGLHSDSWVLSISGTTMSRGVS